MQLSKNIMKCHFYYSFCNQPVSYAQHENVNKLWNNNRIVQVNERNQNKNKIDSRHIQIDHALYCSIQPTNSAMVSLKDSFTVWRQSQKEDFLSIIWFGSAWCLVTTQMQFSLIKNKDWTFRTLANPPPTTSDNISFLPETPYLPNPPPKWTSYLYYPLHCFIVCILILYVS